MSTPVDKAIEDVQKAQTDLNQKVQIAKKASLASVDADREYRAAQTNLEAYQDALLKLLEDIPLRS